MERQQQTAPSLKKLAALWRACYLCLLCVINPKILAAEQDRDNVTLAACSGAATKQNSATIVCRAFWLSLLLVAISAVLGFTVGELAIVFVVPEIAAHLVTPLQLVGAFLLLWGTLFVRGWDIQTHGGVTLTERVNQWLYRGMYFVGTTLVVISLTISWGQQ